MDDRRANDLRLAAAGAPDLSWRREPEPPDTAEYLRWFIDNDAPPTGSGPNGLADYCQQVTTYWAERDAPNIHLFHYQDLWDDLASEMRRVAKSLGVRVAEARWPEFVEAATLDSMRSRAAETAPEAHLALWHDTNRFFRSGGNRDWSSLLSDAEIAHFHERLAELTGSAARWVLTGRAGFHS